MGGGGVWLSGRGRIFEKNIPNNSGMIYLLFDGKRRNLAHCLLLSSFLLGSETLQGTRKISARIIFQTGENFVSMHIMISVT